MFSYFKKAQIMLNEYVNQYLWSRLSPEWTLSSDITVKVKSRAEWVIYNDIFIEGEYDTSVSKVVNSGVENPLILDIGANIGYFALHFGDRWIQKHGKDSPFKIMAFEGTPQVYRELQSRVNSTSIKDNCDLHLGLIGNKSGEGYISTSPFHVTNCLTDKPSLFSEKVSYLNLNEIIPVDRRITLLKCDIEGAEELFLENYKELLTHVDNVAIELHHTRCDVDNCINILKEAGLTKHTRIRDCLPEFTVDFFERA